MEPRIRYAQTADGVSTAISVRDLRKAYGSTIAVDGMSLDVAAGEIFGLIGPNGSGKTTTVECIQGLRRPDSGSIQVLGFDPQLQRRELRRHIGCQLQKSALPDRIKVWEALDLFASMVPGAADWRILMEQWGLNDKRNTAFANLSGGQRQRLLVALALVNEPNVVLLDEMTTGLDPSARRVAWDLIAAIRERGTTVVLVTHFMDEAEQLCDRIAIMNQGRIVASDTPRRLIDNHAGDTRVMFSTDALDLSWLDTVQHVSQVTRSDGEVEVLGTGPVLALVAAALVEHGILPADLRVERSTLEDVFLKLTRRSILD
ncbi:MAG: ABC transporter ATP-binding protein [Dehalococcoidia bacterium]